MFINGIFCFVICLLMLIACSFLKAFTVKLSYTLSLIFLFITVFLLYRSWNFHATIKLSFVIFLHSIRRKLTSIEFYFQLLKHIFIIFSNSKSNDVHFKFFDIQKFIKNENAHYFSFYLPGMCVCWCIYWCSLSSFSDLNLNFFF